MAKNRILPDGSVEGKTFSGDSFKGEYPEPKEGETYGRYHQRVNKLKAEGFHLGDLSWGDWQNYCMGSGNFEGADPNEVIDQPMTDLSKILKKGAKLKAVKLNPDCPKIQASIAETIEAQKKILKLKK